jgi:hypothetical protein
MTKKKIFEFQSPTTILVKNSIPYILNVFLNDFLTCQNNAMVVVDNYKYQYFKYGTIDSFMIHNRHYEQVIIKIVHS